MKYWKCDINAELWGGFSVHPGDKFIHSLLKLSCLPGKISLLKSNQELDYPLKWSYFIQEELKCLAVVSQTGSLDSHMCQKLDYLELK